MAWIRRLSYFDINKIRKMISYLNEEGLELARSLEGEILAKIQGLLPLRFGFLPESFVLTEKKEILGLITVNPTSGNPYKINITRLVFSKNMYDIAKQLVEFVIAKFGAKGASSFSVMINENDNELMNLFINGCGFRQCSCEVLWRMPAVGFARSNLKFRNAQNSDAKQIASLYNMELESIYKPSLLRKIREFKEPFFDGFNKFYKNRYVLEEISDSRIVAYISITTGDNTNFILDICVNEAYSISYDDIIAFANSVIGRFKSNFSLFVKQRKYSKNSESLEKYLKFSNYQAIQTQHVLIKDYYKTVKQNNVIQVFSLGEKLNLQPEPFEQN